MNAFSESHGFARYHYVQHANAPRYPYGVCGPFPTEHEANEALAYICAAFPAVDLHVEQAGFSTENSLQMLSMDNAKACRRLELLKSKLIIDRYACSPKDSAGINSVTN